MYDKIIKDNAILIINNELCTFNNYLKPKSPGIYTIKIILTKLIDDCCKLFYECENIIKIDLSSFNTINVKDMRSMFKGCKNLINLDLSSFNTINVKYMYKMFEGCKNLRYNSLQPEFIKEFEKNKNK